MINQIFNLEEQETLININYGDRKIRIYTTRATVMNRLIKDGYRPIKQEHIDGEICSMTFESDISNIGKFLRRSIFRYS